MKASQRYIHMMYLKEDVLSFLQLVESRNMTLVEELRSLGWKNEKRRSTLLLRMQVRVRVLALCQEGVEAKTYDGKSRSGVGEASMFCDFGRHSRHHSIANHSN